MSTTSKNSETTTKKRTKNSEIDPAVKDVLARFRKLSPEGQKQLRDGFTVKDEAKEVELLLAEADALNPEERAALSAALDKKRSRKPKKLEGQPSQGRTGYNIFMHEALAAVKQKNPKMDHGDAMKAVGAIWGNMTADEKAPYEEMSKKEKETQAPLLAAFKAQHPEHFDAETGKRINSNGENEEDDEEVATPSGKSAKKRAKRSVKKAKDPNAPKRPLTAAFIFQNHAYKNLGETFFKDIPKSERRKHCAAHWANMTDAEKAPFKRQEEEAKKRYEAAKASYEAQKASGEGADLEELEPTLPLEAEAHEESSEVSSSSDDEE